MYPILDDLYLASYNDVKYSGQFDSDEFVVVNCTKNLKMLGYGTRIAVDDDRTHESNLILYSSLPFVCQWIKQHLDNGQPVVVHCHAGQQRSAAVMAAYLMWTRKMSLEQCVLYIRLCKPDAFLYDVNFREALQKWSKALE